MKEGTKHTEETKAKIAESMGGNENAEKYTEEVVVDLLKQMLDYASKPIRGGYEDERVHLKKELLFKFGIYNEKWFANMATKFEGNETVFNLLRACAHVCEINSYKAATYGSANPMMVKMHLSTHYDWSDKTATETKEIKKLTPKEVKEQIAYYEKLKGKK
jgi:hypothetical protein